LGGFALAREGSDLIGWKGVTEAVNAAQKDGVGVFAAFTGGSSRYKTGSDADLSSFSLMTGLSWGTALNPGRLTLGAFFEYGTGSYDNNHSFSGISRGEGDADYAGGGVLGRMDFKGSASGRAYAEASLRAGSANNEYKHSDLFSSGSGSYDASSGYFGIHLGGGYIFNLNDKASLDLYGKYFWMRLAGDSVTLASGDPIDFKAINSHRVRVGGRIGYAVNEFVSPYFGAAFEREFDGKASASTYGYAIDTPSLKGNTGIGELGIAFTVSKNMPLHIDLGAQGYVGQRKGVTGSLRLKYEF